MTGVLVLALSLGMWVQSTQAYQCSCICGAAGREAAVYGAQTAGACATDTCSVSVCNTMCAGQGGSTIAGECLNDDTAGAQNCVEAALGQRNISPRRLQALRDGIAAINTRFTQQSINWSCQGLPGNIVDPNRCIEGGCMGDPLCCVPSTGSAPVGATNAGADAPIAPTVAGENCTDVAIRRGTPTSTVTTIVTQTGSERPSWTCQRTCDARQRGNCVARGCPDTEDTVLCCPPTIGIPIGEQCGGRGAAGGTDGTGTGSSAGGGFGIAALVLPDCATTRDPARAGKCQIADVFELGYSAVKFMFGLSGALLLVAFVVAGFKYLVNGYAGKIQEAKDTMVNAALGMVIMLFAYIIVTFIYNSLKS